MKVVNACVCVLVLCTNSLVADPVTTCLAPQVVAVSTLPYFDIEDGTCDGDWDTDADCLGLHSMGESSFYRIENDLTVPVSVQITLNASTPFTGVAAFLDCADPLTCLWSYDSGWSSGDLLDIEDSVLLAAGGLFFLRIGNNAPPDCPAYALQITVSDFENDSCAGAEYFGFEMSQDGLWVGNTGPSWVSNDYFGIGAQGVGSCSAPTAGNSADLVYFFDVTNGSGNITLALDAPTWDAVLWVISSCADPMGSAVDCSDSTNPEVLSLSSLSNGRYYVIVDGASGERGPFQLTSSGTSIPVELFKLTVE